MIQLLRSSSALQSAGAAASILTGVCIRTARRRHAGRLDDWLHGIACDAGLPEHLFYASWLACMMLNGEVQAAGHDCSTVAPAAMAMRERSSLQVRVVRLLRCRCRTPVWLLTARRRAHQPCMQLPESLFQHKPHARLLAVWHGSQLMQTCGFA